MAHIIPGPFVIRSEKGVSFVRLSDWSSEWRHTARVHPSVKAPKSKYNLQCFKIKLIAEGILYGSPGGTSYFITSSNFNRSSFKSKKSEVRRKKLEVRSRKLEVGT